MEANESKPTDKEGFDLSILELPDKLISSTREDVTISCLHVSANGILFIGYDNGDILVYKLKSNSSGRPPIQATHIVSGTILRKKKIIQMQFIPQFNFVIILTVDGRATVHKLETLESVALIPVKRADMFSVQFLKGQVDTNFEPSVSLCIVSGTKAFLYNLSSGEITKTLMLPERPTSVVWFEEDIHFSFPKMYSNINSVSLEPQEHMNHANSPSNVITLAPLHILPTEEIVIPTQTTITLIKDPLMKLGVSKKIIWSSVPKNIGISFPYLIASDSQQLEVVDLLGVNCVPTSLPLPKFKMQMQKQKTPSKVLMADNNRLLVIAINMQLFVFETTFQKEFITNMDIILSEFKDNLDEEKFSKLTREFLSEQFGATDNPFLRLLSVYQMYFMEIINSLPQHATEDEEELKQKIYKSKRIFKSLTRRGCKAVCSWCGELSEISAEITTEVIYSFVHSFFSSKIMNPMLQFYRELFKKEDQLYVQGVSLLKEAPMARFGVRRKFFLNKQSIQDEISLHKQLTQNVELEKIGSPKTTAEVAVVSSDTFLLSWEGNEIAFPIAELHFNKKYKSILWVHESQTFKIHFYEDQAFHSFKISCNKQIQVDLRSSQDKEIQISEKVEEKEQETKAYAKPIELLSNLAYIRGVTEQLETITNIMQNIAKEVEVFWKEHNPKKAIFVGADDMMPILCYFISRSAPPHLYSLLQFLYDFADEYTIKGHHGYGLISLQAALDGFIRLSGAPIPSKKVEDMIAKMEMVSEDKQDKSQKETNLLSRSIRQTKTFTNFLFSGEWLK